MVAELKIPESRRLATFRIVDNLLPIDGADAIEVAQVGGWKVVVKKGEFKVGDPCVYFEIDTFLPEGEPAWQFLVDKSPRVYNGVKGHKLRTIKLRGQISQGFIIPARLLPTTAYVLATEEISINTLRAQLTPEQLAIADNCRFGINEHEAGLDPRDLDLSELLGVSKWEAVLHASLAGQAEGLFPSFIRKTDQERCQNLVREIFGYDDQLVPFVGQLPTEAIDALVAKGELRWVGDTDIAKVIPGKAVRNALYEVTMKLDGSSGTFFVRSKFLEPVQLEDGTSAPVPEVGVCSRNLQLKISDANKENTFVRVLFDTCLNVALENFHLNTGRSIAIQGEVMGPSIQGNRESLKAPTFFVFDIYDIDKSEYVTQADRFAIFRELRLISPQLRHVPMLVLGSKPGSGPAKFVEFDAISYEDFVCHSLEHLGLTTVDELLAFAEGPSLVHPIREGVVFKRDDGQFSFKAISNQFLAKEKD